MEMHSAIQNSLRAFCGAHKMLLVSFGREFCVRVALGEE